VKEGKAYALKVEMYYETLKKSLLRLQYHSLHHPSSIINQSLQTIQPFISHHSSHTVSCLECIDGHISHSRWIALQQKGQCSHHSDSDDRQGRGRSS
jgi:hypothetical protein